MNRILYAQAVFGQEEKDAVMQTLENSWLSNGQKVHEFEAAVAKLFGKKYAMAVNSGSSANMIAVTCLNLPPGSEVITPACTFSTTVAPLIQNGLVPVFVDSVVGRYVIDESAVEAAITDKTKLLMIPQLVGGVVDMERMRALADKHGLYIIDDCCDTIAPLYKGLPVARFSDIVTTSFYGSHLITAMGTGGMVMTDDEKLYERMLLLNNWGRVGATETDFEKRFDFETGDVAYDSEFYYAAIGYNMRMAEASAAFGLEQLKRLQDFKNARRVAFIALTEYFKKYEKWFYLPELIDEAETTWLAYPLTVKDGAPFTRREFLKHLDSNNVQIRVLMSGNITRHPAYNSQFKEFPHADLIMKSGLLIGCHQGLSTDDIERLMSICEEFLNK